MLEAIGTLDNVRPYLEQKLAAKEKLMGFGHRIYKVKDPRATILQKLAKTLFAQLERHGHSSLYELAEEVERIGEELLRGKAFTPTSTSIRVCSTRLWPRYRFLPVLFAMARVSGWLAHWLEQLKDNKLFRPDQIYEGRHRRAYVPIDRRLEDPPQEPIEARTVKV
ncbi:MAG: hypothetical protein KatS3mg082_0976 [Nitrospiraceae bacterium]|nr:MAG: hypothetical protein KatS3mg082_0976 [Nitrospiraceae bacterium]